MIGSLRKTKAECAGHLNREADLSEQPDGHYIHRPMLIPLSPKKNYECKHSKSNVYSELITIVIYDNVNHQNAMRSTRRREAWYEQYRQTVQWVL